MTLSLPSPFCDAGRFWVCEESACVCPGATQGTAVGTILDTDVFSWIRGTERFIRALHGGDRPCEIDAGGFCVVPTRSENSFHRPAPAPPYHLLIPSPVVTHRHVSRTECRQVWRLRRCCSFNEDWRDWPLLYRRMNADYRFPDYRFPDELLRLAQSLFSLRRIPFGRGSGRAARMTTHASVRLVAFRNGWAGMDLKAVLTNAVLQAREKECERMSKEARQLVEAREKFTQARRLVLDRLRGQSPRTASPTLRISAN